MELSIRETVLVELLFQQKKVTTFSPICQEKNFENWFQENLANLAIPAYLHLWNICSRDFRQDSNFRSAMNQASVLDKLQKNVHAKLLELTPIERKIASYLIEHYQEVALISIHELAHRLEVGRASIVRLTNKLGYDGFASLKGELKAELKQEITPLERFTVALKQPIDGSHLQIHKIARQEVQNINATLHLIDKSRFRKAVKIICDAEGIFTLGMGISNYVAELTAYLFKRIGFRATALNQSGLKFTEQLITVNPRDALVIFSLPPYSQETLDAAAFARKQGAKIVAFTNMPAAPVVQFADVYLVAKTESSVFSNSLSALLVLVTALSAEAASKDRARSEEAIKKIIALR
jgi:DNA-binding MurR/RpiR family transcriptional regulator